MSDNKPFAVEVEAGKTYYWCSCGKTANQPLCDGAHKDTGKTPLPFKAEASETRYFCGCKQSKNPPFCDGTHSL
jgi:CDGSH iron-sulfur domain-containing protein 3